ncbi:2-hydroxychromene-2-carboxylate isomerase [Babesia caballi]|uniref:2-hydroxychromene-2-carboxylate isomerase n=1 Tax=Babesia caballi TaxID=5871 RepID=A0AAV4M170_BABCB|nr:2-hydroxychromene-2-carboxylate isomerase [Babesia caballi]
MRAKVYNSRLYTPDGAEKLPRANKSAKIDEDYMDYDKVSRELMSELLKKITFLSNRECVLILDLLGRIKKPLHRVRYDRVRDSATVKDVVRASGGERMLESAKTVHLDRRRPTDVDVPRPYEAITNDPVVRLVVKAQRVLLDHVVRAYEQGVLTKAQRYYLVCALSRECSLVSVETWLSLKAGIKEDLKFKNDCLPFEYANLLLIYDQICRWVGKRWAKAAAPGTTGCSHQGAEDGSHLVTHIQRKETQDPFDVEFFEAILYKMRPLLGQLKIEKIVKLLYLQCSRRVYDRGFFEAAFKALAQREVTNAKELVSYRAAIGMYHRAAMVNLWQEFKALYAKHDTGCLNLGDGDVILRTALGALRGADGFVDMSGFGVLRLRANSDLAESITMCLVSLIALHMRNMYRCSNMEPPNYSAVVDSLFNHGDKGHDVASILRRCMTEERDLHQIRSDFDVVFNVKHVSGLMKVVVSHICFGRSMLSHLPKNPECDHVRQRSALVLFCMSSVVQQLLDFVTEHLNRQAYAHDHDELRQLIAMVKTISVETQLRDEFRNLSTVMDYTRSRAEELERRLG